MFYYVYNVLQCSNWKIWQDPYFVALHAAFISKKCTFPDKLQSLRKFVNASLLTWFAKCFTIKYPRLYPAAFFYHPIFCGQPMQISMIFCWKPAQQNNDHLIIWQYQIPSLGNDMVLDVFGFVSVFLIISIFYVFWFIFVIFSCIWWNRQQFILGHQQCARWWASFGRWLKEKWRHIYINDDNKKNWK